jgi:hypothetical protein
LVELAAKSAYDPSYLQRLEKGVRLGSLDAMNVLDRLYGTGDLLSKLWRMAKRQAGQSRYQGFAELEAKATSIQEFSVSTVPGLLQTPGYAETLLRTFDPDSDELLAEQVRDRINRQGPADRREAAQLPGFVGRVGDTPTGAGHVGVDRAVGTADRRRAAAEPHCPGRAFASRTAQSPQQFAPAALVAEWEDGLLPGNQPEWPSRGGNRGGGAPPAVIRSATGLRVVAVRVS